MERDDRTGHVFTFYSDTINFKSVEDETGKKFYVEGYISTHDKDLVNDIVTDQCMKSMEQQLQQRNIKIDFEHEAFRGETEFESQLNKTKMPLGRIVNQSRDEKGLKVTAMLNPAWNQVDKEGKVVQDFDKVWGAVKGKFLDAFSIAYVPTRIQEQKDSMGDEVRMLDNVNLLNVALTGNPINQSATMTNVFAKSLAFMREEIMKGETMEEQPKKPKEEEKQEKEEQEKKQKEEEEQKQEEEDEEKKEEEKPKEESKKCNKKAEEKSVESNFKSELIEIKSEIAEIKSLLEEARPKAKVSQPEQKAQEMNVDTSSIIKAIR